MYKNFYTFASQWFLGLNESFHNFFLGSELKGNWVRIPNSPAAVNLNREKSIFFFKTQNVTVENLWEDLKEWISQKTCHEQFFKHQKNAFEEGQDGL